MKMRIVAAVAAALLLGGCGGQAPNAGEPAPEVTVTATATVTVTQVTTPTPTPSAASASLLKVGQKYAGPDVDVTVEQVKPNERLGTLPERYYSVLVRLCLKSDVEATVGVAPWKVHDDDDGRYNAPIMDAGTSLPSPSFPDGATITKGECVKGWIYFVIPEKTKIMKITYESRDNKAAWAA